MPRKTPPSMDLYWDDLIAGTTHFHAIELGMYVRLLAFQWGNDFIPEDQNMICRITGISDEEFKKHWPQVQPKFLSEDGKGLFNERLKAEKDKKLAVSEARAAARRGKGHKQQQQLKNNCFTNEKQTGRRNKEEGRREKALSEEENVELLDLIDWWNRLHADGHVHSRVRGINQGIRKGWARVRASEPLDELLQKRDELARQIAQSELLGQPWFTLSKLMGASNKTGELIIENILEGVYSGNSHPGKPKQGAGQKFLQGVSDVAESL